MATRFLLDTHYKNQYECHSATESWADILVLPKPTHSMARWQLTWRPFSHCGMNQGNSPNRFWTTKCTMANGIRWRSALEAIWIRTGVFKLPNWGTSQMCGLRKNWILAKRKYWKSKRRVLNWSFITLNDKNKFCHQVEFFAHQLESWRIFDLPNRKMKIVPISPAIPKTAGIRRDMFDKTKSRPELTRMLAHIAPIDANFALSESSIVPSR